MIPAGLQRMYLFITEGHRYKSGPNDYDAKRYWSQRHGKDTIDSLQAVGHKGLSAAENYAQYKSASLIFKGMCAELGIGPEHSTLELGYGTGFYTNLCHEMGIVNYHGIDIVGKYVDVLNKKFPMYSFQELDAGIELVKPAQRDLIYMIDVTQHITNDEKLRFCLKNNVRNQLRDGGLFIVTDELHVRRISFYEVHRSLSFYEEALEMDLIFEPIQFRDKYIFAFRK